MYIIRILDYQPLRIDRAVRGAVALELSFVIYLLPLVLLAIVFYVRDGLSERLQPFLCQISVILIG